MPLKVVEELDLEAYKTFFFFFSFVGIVYYEFMMMGRIVSCKQSVYFNKTIVIWPCGQSVHSNKVLFIFISNLFLVYFLELSFDCKIGQASFEDS